jgi:hypothetical protein
MSDVPAVPPPKVYEPGDPDPLRDGLFEGFWRHRVKLAGPDA